MAAMDRVRLYRDSYESPLEKLHERGLVFMPSCRRKAVRNIVSLRRFTRSRRIKVNR